MQPGWITEPATSGNCQCGAVRFEIESGPARSTVCHCRMCQRATGNAFAPLLEVMASAVTWSGDAPTVWASSNVAERGFCNRCGTPLFYRIAGGDTIEFMAGALHRSFAFRPVVNNGLEARVGWLDRLPGLPGRVTPREAERTIRSNQLPEDT